MCGMQVHMKQYILQSKKKKAEKDKGMQREKWRLQFKIG